MVTRSSRHVLFGTIVALALAGGAASAAAQVGGNDFIAGTGVYLETYDFLDPAVVGLRRISLVTLPLATRLPALGPVALEVRSSFARGDLEREDGSTVTLSGLTDTELRATFATWGDRAILTGAVLLPTGNSSHDLEESELAGLIAADLVPFRISNWGTGGGLGMATTVAVPLGDFAVGVTAGYTAGREFEPLEADQLAYRPGDEVRVRLAVDRTIGTSAKASVLLGTQYYRDDQFAGESVFRPGNRVEGFASLAFAVGEVSTGITYAGFQRRGAGRLTVEDLETPAQNLLTAGGGFRIPVGAMTFAPTLDLRLLRRADGVGQGHLTSLGATFEMPAGPIMFAPALRGRFGRVLLWEGEDSSVRGAEIGIGGRISL